MIVVADTTPIITLLKIEHLDILKRYFGEVLIPCAVFEELTGNDKYRDEAIIVKSCDFIKVAKVENVKSVDLLRRTSGLDLGESEAIVLSDELKADLLLIDEAKGRDVAEKLELKIMGTIGLLMASYDVGVITSDEVYRSIEVVRSTGRHIGERYLKLLLERINK